MIMDQYQENFDAHTENLSRALYTYFSDKEEKKNLPVLDQLLRRLVRVQVQMGRSFLNPSEKRHFFEDLVSFWVRIR